MEHAHQLRKVPLPVHKAERAFRVFIRLAVFLAQTGPVILRRHGDADAVHGDAFMQDHPVFAFSAHVGLDRAGDKAAVRGQDLAGDRVKVTDTDVIGLVEHAKRILIVRLVHEGDGHIGADVIDPGIALALFRKHAKALPGRGQPRDRLAGDHAPAFKNVVIHLIERLLHDPVFPFPPILFPHPLNPIQSRCAGEGFQIN